MRLVRVATPGGPRAGRIEGTEIVLEGGDAVPLATARLLAPVLPTKIVAVATNYSAHAAEMGKTIPETPRIFLKPPSSVIGPSEPIRIPPGTTRVDPECELGVVIGRRIGWNEADDVASAILGYTCLNDVTCRDFQKADGVFARGKGFDTFCPLGPWIETDLDPSDLLVQTIVNGEVRASGRTSEMIFGIAALVAFAARVMTLEPGDVVATGTPPGVAPIRAGDRVAVSVQGIGVLENPVEDRADRRP